MQSSNPLFLRDDELERMLELVFRSYQRLFAASYQIQFEDGLAELDHRILFAIHRKVATSVKALSLLLGLSKQTVSRHVRAMVRNGLLQEESFDGDRRRKELLISNFGVSFVNSVAVQQKRQLRAVLRQTDSHAVRGFEEIMRQLCREPSGQTPPR